MYIHVHSTNLCSEVKPTAWVSVANQSKRFAIYTRWMPWIGLQSMSVHKVILWPLHTKRVSRWVESSKCWDGSPWLYIIHLRVILVVRSSQQRMRSRVHIVADLSSAMNSNSILELEMQFIILSSLTWARAVCALEQSRSVVTSGLNGARHTLSWRLTIYRLLFQEGRKMACYSQVLNPISATLTCALRCLSDLAHQACIFAQQFFQCRFSTDMKKKKAFTRYWMLLCIWSYVHQARQSGGGGEGFTGLNGVSLRPWTRWRRNRSDSALRLSEPCLPLEQAQAPCPTSNLIQPLTFMHLC